MVKTRRLSREIKGQVKIRVLDQKSASLGVRRTQVQFSFREGGAKNDVWISVIKTTNDIIVSFSTLSFFLQLRCVEDLQTIQVIKILRYEKKMAKMCFLMIFTFLISWMPYIVICFLVVNGSGHLVTPTVSIVSYLFAKSSTVYNPVIYIFMIRKVSFIINQLFSLWGCIIWKHNTFVEIIQRSSNNKKQNQEFYRKVKALGKNIGYSQRKG